MVFLNILRDNREQKPWDFDRLPVNTQDVTISTGDYTLVEFCDHDEEQDTYNPNYSIERKAGNDLVNSITHNSDRFLREIKRTNDWDSKLRVLIEEPKRTISRNRSFMRYNDMSPSQVLGIIDKWERNYNVSFEFVGTRERAQQIAFDAFSSRLRKKLLSHSE